MDTNEIRDILTRAKGGDTEAARRVWDIIRAPVRADADTPFRALWDALAPGDMAAIAAQQIQKSEEGTPTPPSSCWR